MWNSKEESDVSEQARWRKETRTEEELATLPMFELRLEAEVMCP